MNFIKKYIKITLFKILFFVLLPATIIPQTFDKMLVYPPYGHSMGLHRANASTYKMIYGKSIKFDQCGGISAVKLKSANRKGSDDDDELTVFLADQINGSILYNIGFDKLISYNKNLKNPIIVKANSDGQIIVGDIGTKEVTLLQYKNDSLIYVKTILKGIYPSGIDFGEKNIVFITDKIKNKLFKVNFDGTILKSINIPSPKKLVSINSNDTWLVSGKPFLVVIANNGKSIIKYDNNLNEIIKYDIPSYEIDDCNLEDIACDFYRGIYLVDEKYGRLLKFNSNLEFIGTFGSMGMNDKQFYHPLYISIWKRYGQIFIVDMNGISYYWIGVDGNIIDVSPPELTPKYPGITFVIYSTDYSIGYFKIYNSKGKTVRNFMIPKRLKPGKNYLLWDGKSNRGKLCPDGNYKVDLTLEPTYSSKGHFKRHFNTNVIINYTGIITIEKKNERYEEDWF